MNDEKIKFRMFITIETLCFLILLVCGGIIFFDDNTATALSEETLNCNGTDLLFVADCLNKELSRFYNYNISNAYLYFRDRSIDWDVIKNEGGVCWHYAQWYIESFKALGFDADIENIEENSDWAGHAYAKVWNYDHSVYCIMDQKDYWCQRLMPISSKTVEGLRK